MEAMNEQYMRRRGAKVPIHVRVAHGERCRKSTNRYVKVERVTRLRTVTIMRASIFDGGRNLKYILKRMTIQISKAA